MAFPGSPTNGQTAIVNGITYAYNATIQSWTRIKNAGTTSNPSIYLGTTQVTTVPTLVDTQSISGNTYFRWTVTAIDNINNNFASASYDTINDGTNVYSAQSATLQSNPFFNVATFTSNITGGNINLYAVGDSTNVTVSFQRTTLGSSTSTGYLNAGPQGGQGPIGPGGTVNNTSDVIQTTNPTASTNQTTGALLVQGGAGIGGNIYSGGDAIAAGRMSATTMTSTNGISMNSNNISASVAIPSNTNAQSIGPINQLPGVVVTQLPNSRWSIV